MSKYIPYFDIAKQQLANEISFIGKKEMEDIFEKIIIKYGNLNYDLDANRLKRLAGELKKSPFFIKKTEDLITRNLEVLKYAQENTKKVWDHGGSLLQVEGDMPLMKKFFHPLTEKNIPKLVLSYNESYYEAFDAEYSYSKDLMKILYSKINKQEWDYILGENTLGDKIDLIYNMFKSDIKELEKERKRILTVLKKSTVERLIGEDLFFEKLLEVEYEKRDRLIFLVFQNLIEKMENFDFKEFNMNNFSKLKRGLAEIFEEITNKNSIEKFIEIDYEKFFTLNMESGLSKEENRSKNIEQFTKLVNFKKIFGLDKKDVDKYLRMWATLEPETFNIDVLTKSAMNGKTSTYRELNDRFDSFVWLSEKNLFIKTKDFKEKNYDTFIVKKIMHDENLWIEIDVKKLSFFVGTSELEATNTVKRIAKTFENKLYKNNLLELDLKEKKIDNMQIELEKTSDKKEIIIDLLMEAVTQTSSARDLRDLFYRLNREFSLMEKLSGKEEKLRVRHKI